MAKSPAKRAGARARATLHATAAKAAAKPKEAAPPASVAAPRKPSRPPTAFESRLYAVCKCVPAGRVTTYGAMAQVLGSAPRACGQVSAGRPRQRAQACWPLEAGAKTAPAVDWLPDAMPSTHPSLPLTCVAPPPRPPPSVQALRRNPFAPAVPCHRVIAASLELGGFSGSWGVGCANVQKKRRLLAEEGVAFDSAGRLQGGGAVMGAAELARVAAHVL